MTSFPLLRLPQLALVEVLQCLNPLELFILAQCSRRATNVVPLSKSKNFGIICDSEENLRINQEYRFKIEQLTEESEIDFKCKYINCSVEFYGYNTLTIYLSNGENGYEKLLWYLYDLFKCRIKSIRYTLETDLGQFQVFLNRVFKEQNGIEEFVIGSTSDRPFQIEPNHWKNALDISQTLNITEKLIIDFCIREPFAYNFKKLPKHLDVSRANWFTMNNLIQAASACTNIRLYFSGLVNESLAEFMRRWEDGEFPNLKLFFCSFRFSTHWNGTELEGFFPRNLMKREQIPMDGGHFLPKVQFKREDGKIAEYRYNADLFFEFTVL